MDEAYLLATVRYVERNPVVARLCHYPHEWEWSSAAAHFNGVDDELVRVKPMLDRVDDWAAYLSDTNERSEEHEHIERHTRTGRPLGDMRFVGLLETLTGKQLAPKRPGRKSNRNSS